MKGISANTTKIFFISFERLIEPIGMLVDFLPLRELTVDHQDFDPILFLKIPFNGLNLTLISDHLINNFVL